MSRFKFRVWTKTMKMMWYNGFNISDRGRVNFGWGFMGDEEMKTVELMQFTGLHDKNGKDIYDGDVIRTSLGVTAAVEWEKEGRFLAFTVDRKIIYINREPAVEVIGNIHENPELLERNGEVK